MGVGLVVDVAVAPLAVGVEVAAVVGLATGGVKVGVAETASVEVGVFDTVGVIVAVLTGRGGQGCNWTVNCRQLFPSHIFKSIGVFCSPRQSTTCLSPVVSTLVQPILTPLVGDTVAVGVRIVTVASAGITSKACARVSTQNWQTSETFEPVSGIPGVNVVFGVAVVVSVGLTATVGVSVAAVEVGRAVGVGDPC